MNVMLCLVCYDCLDLGFVCSKARMDCDHNVSVFDE